MVEESCAFIISEHAIFVSISKALRGKMRGGEKLLKKSLRFPRGI